MAMPTLILTFFVTAVFLACTRIPCDAVPVRRNPYSTTRPQPLMNRVCSKTPYPSVCRKEIFATEGVRAARQETSVPNIVLVYTKSAATRVSDTLRVARGLSARVGADVRARGVEKQALKDCIQLLSDAQDELHDVVADLQAFGSFKGAEKRHRISDVRTWASAGLTDQDTCSDEMASYGELTTRPLKLRLSYLSQVISNTLSLLAKLAAAGSAP